MATNSGYGGQQQFATSSVSTVSLAKPITLSRLAARSHLSERTLTRRFREETGTSPLQWLLRQRIDRAQELLETTTLAMWARAWEWLDHPRTTPASRTFRVGFARWP
jgi:transcriptional regulator GlxA family with amidase domain